jgi:co-chaperonin GroES (HSP10)
MIVPLLHTILIKPDTVEERTESGIYIARELIDKERKAVEYGTVVRVGQRAFLDYGCDPTLLKEGDRVSFARYSGKAVKDKDGTEYLLVNDIDILAIIEE